MEEKEGGKGERGWLIVVLGVCGNITRAAQVACRKTQRCASPLVLAFALGCCRECGVRILMKSS